MIDNQTIQEATDRLVTSFHPNRVILFGSYARGTADKHSDVDLLVVCSLKGNRRSLMVAMDRALRGLGFARDIVVLTPEEVRTGPPYPRHYGSACMVGGKGPL